MSIEQDITESMYLDKIAELSALVDSLREGLQQIYSARGEDKLVADIASPLIDSANTRL